MTGTLVIGTAGHIDHGKSALVKALTGTDPDRLKEERERGITIDLGFAHASIGGVAVSFVDVPGHERFVRNMLAGAGGIDAVLLVIAADESVMPQTREHFDICRLLGIERGVIALTKADLVDADTIELAALEARELVEGSFLEGAPVLPVSARTGEGLDALGDALRGLAAHARPRGRPGVVRLPIDRVFTVKGFGTVVTGTLASGRVQEGDALVGLPEDRPVRVRGLQVHGRPVHAVSAPSRVALNLGSVDAGDLARGVTLATAGGLAVTRRIDAHLTLVSGARPLRHGARVRVHHGTDEVLGRVAIAATRAGCTGDWTRAEAGTGGVAVPGGGEAYVRVRLERPAVFTRGDRAVIRAYSPSRTIGGLVVLDPEPPAAGVRRPATLERFGRLQDAAAFPLVWLAESGLKGLESSDLVRRGGLSPAEAAARIAALVADQSAVAIGGRAVEAARTADVARRITVELERFHDAYPLDAGMPRESLRDRVAPGAPPAVFESVIGTLAAAGVVNGTDRLGLRSRSAMPIDPGTADAMKKVERAILAAGLMPPDVSALPSMTGLGPATIDQVVRLLVREQHLVRVGALVFHAEVLTRLRAEIGGLKAAGTPAAPATVDVGTFKTRYGLSRKFAIPLLEWLDRERVTRRMGEKRLIL